MTPLSWTCVGAAVAIGAGASRAPARIGALVAVGRLPASAGRGHRGTAVGAGLIRALARSRWISRAAVIAPAALVVVFGGPVLGLAGAAVSGAAALIVRDALRTRAVATRRRQLLAALRVLIGELEAGARALFALNAAAETAPAYVEVFQRAASAAARAHDAAAVLRAEPDTRAIGLAWQLGEDTGAALAGVLDRVADDLADIDEQRRTVAIALAGPRASAGLLAALPLLGMGLGAAMDARPWAFLLGPGPGRIVCCAGVLLDVAGVLWMRRILSRAEGS